MKRYRVLSVAGAIVWESESSFGPADVAEMYVTKVYGTDAVSGVRISGQEGKDGYFWARFFRVEQFVGQPFKVEEISE